MSLWELGAIVHEWNERQPKSDTPPALDLDDDEMPDMEAWAQATAAAQRIVSAAQEARDERHD